MKTKLTVLMILLFAITLVFTACGGADSTETSTPAEAETTEADDNEVVAEGDMPVFQIYSDNAFPPFHILDVATGEFTGFDVDLLEAIAADQGFRVERHHVGFSAAMGALEAGQADGMIAGMSITDERRERFDFSDGYFQAGQILVVPLDSDIQGFSDLAGEVVAAKIGTVGLTFAEEMGEQYGFEVIAFEDSPTMYSAVLMGEAAAAVEDRPVIEFAIYESDLALQTVGETLNPRYYGFAVRKGEFPELIEMFNQGLANLRESGYYNEILARYGLN
ncbi:MAG: transporter substrate-binding domain-containing protein [Lachnospiraceae bacterium]|nr:transporter substrate-binding domain-containing protein [Lachnospiraceae bacterium]